MMSLIWLQKEEWTAADSTFKLHKSKLELAKEEAAAARSHTLSAFAGATLQYPYSSPGAPDSSFIWPCNLLWRPQQPAKLLQTRLQPALQGSMTPTGSARFELRVVCFHNAGMLRLIAAKVDWG